MQISTKILDLKVLESSKFWLQRS